MEYCAHILEDTERRRSETFSGTFVEDPIDNLVEVLVEKSARLAEVVESLVAVAVEFLL